MAKKQTMNIFEAHVEKLVLALALLVFLWVVVNSFIFPAGVEIKGQKRKPSEAVRIAAKNADEIVRQKNIPSNKIPPPYKETAGNLFKRKPFQAVETPLMPAYKWGLIVIDEIRQYSVPDILSLTDPKVDLTSTVAMVPDENDQSDDDSTDNMPRRLELVDKDVDFVTVSASFPMSEMYKMFENSFIPDREKPLEQPEPVVAVLELQRRQLLPDGSWSDYDTVPRIDVDPMVDIELSPREIDTLSQTAYQLQVDDRHDYQIQIDLLQPQPYELRDEYWISPVEQAEDDGTSKSKRADRKRAGKKPRPDRRKPKTAKKGAASDKGATDLAALLEMMGMGAPGAAPKQKPKRGADKQRPGAFGKAGNKPDDLIKEKLLVWAHDSRVQPGSIYSYRLRLGFFNPIADKDWFNEQQKDLKFQRILWSKHTYIKEPVHVPKRTFFFPKSTAKSESSSLRFEVFRKHEGTWHSRIFRVAPGSMIGAVKTTKKTATDDSETNDQKSSPDIDFRTGASIIDIVPKVKHSIIKSNMLRDITCTDIIYRDTDGSIKRMGTDNKTWPDDLVKMYRRIKKSIKEQKDQ